MEKHFANLVKKCAREEHVASGDIDELCSISGIERPEIYDSLAAYIAREFAAGRINFVDADAVANFLWAESSFELTGFAKDVFLAFDDGEHLASSEPPDVDPVDKYTRPQIVDLLARQPQV